MPNFDPKTGHVKLLKPESETLARSKITSKICERHADAGTRLAKAGEAAYKALCELQEAISAQGKAETPLLDSAAGQTSPPAGQGGSEPPVGEQPGGNGQQAASGGPSTGPGGAAPKVGRGSGRASPATAHSGEVK